MLRKKALLVLTLIVFAMAEITPEMAAELSCYIVTDDLKSYDLRYLMKKDGEYYTVEDEDTGYMVDFNMCAFLPGKEYFADKTDANGIVIPLTSNLLTP